MRYSSSAQISFSSITTGVGLAAPSAAPLQDCGLDLRTVQHFAHDVTGTPVARVAGVAHCGFGVPCPRVVLNEGFLFVGHYSTVCDAFEVP